MAAEPYLCRDILEGKINGALENLVPLPLNTQASGTQLYKAGRILTDRTSSGLTRVGSISKSP